MYITPSPSPPSHPWRVLRRKQTKSKRRGSSSEDEAVSSSDESVNFGSPSNSGSDSSQEDSSEEEDDKPFIPDEVSPIIFLTYIYTSFLGAP